MFSKFILYIFCSLGIFALLIAAFPVTDFTENQNETIEASYMTDKVAGTLFEQANVTAYENIAQFNLTFGAPEHIITSGLPSGHSLQVRWAYILPSVSQYDRIWISHHWPGFIFSNVEHMHLKPPYDIYDSGNPDLFEPGDSIYRTELGAAEGNKAANASYFEWTDSVTMRCNMFVSPFTIGENMTQAWDSNQLNFTCSFDIDWNQTGLNAFNMIWQIITFQPLDLGVPGLAGSVANAAIAFPLWAMVAIIAVKLIGAIWPFGSGVPD